MTQFAGIPLGAIDFYEDLESNNTREWWSENKGSYESAVREPMLALGAALEEEFGPTKLFRPNRDVRFSHDKSPYKTHQGLVVSTAERMGWYVQISANGLMTAAGWYASTPEVLARYREALDDEDKGAELVDILAELTSAGYGVVGDRLKTRPRGFPADHPFIDLLRYRTLPVERQHGEPEWLSSPEASEHVAMDWRAYRRLMDWLEKMRTGPGANQ